MIYDLIVCWEDGNKDTFTFTSEEAAVFYNSKTSAPARGNDPGRIRKVVENEEKNYYLS